MHGSLLTDIGISIVAATLLAFVARLLRQPLILAYIGAGIAIGPLGLRLIHDQGAILQLSDIGLAFLLFIVGLEIDLKKLFEGARVAGVVTLVQVGGCALLGWGAALALGYTGLPAAYLGVAVAFSSTMIVVKLLSDKGELDTVAGRLTLGVLLFQDVLAIVVLAIQPNISNFSVVPLLLSLGKGLGLAVGSVLVARYVLPHAFRVVAKMPEIMLITSITWCFLVSWLATKAQFSIAMGALIAGVSISTMPYSMDVVAKIRSLRDFFVTLFFVALGMQIQAPTAAAMTALAVLTAATLASRFITVMPVLRRFRYGNRMGALTAIALAQASEFALVIVVLGKELKHVDQAMVSLVAMLLVVTSTISTYMIQANHKLAKWIAGRLEGDGVAEAHGTDSTTGGHASAPIVLVGCFRIGASLIEALKELGEDFVVIDFDPEVHRKLRERGIKCAYGDISHPDTLEHAGVPAAKVLVCTIPNDYLRGIDNQHLVRVLRRLNPTATIIMVAERLGVARELYAEGANYVVMARWLVADRLAQLIKHAETGSLEQMHAAELDKLAEADEVVA